jgi:hypothetical protein
MAATRSAAKSRSAVFGLAVLVVVSPGFELLAGVILWSVSRSPLEAI